jgi:hypothetical protein
VTSRSDERSPRPRRASDRYADDRSVRTRMTELLAWGGFGAVMASIGYAASLKLDLGDITIGPPVQYWRWESTAAGAGVGMLVGVVWWIRANRRWRRPQRTGVT